MRTVEEIKRDAGKDYSTVKLYGITRDELFSIIDEIERILYDLTKKNPLLLLLHKPQFVSWKTF